MSAPQASFRCAVIQLARLGDTIQTLMALKAVKRLYPQLSITVVVREKFAAAVRKVSWIDEVVTLPTSEILSEVKNGGTAEGVRALAQWVAPLVQNRWDFVANFTFSETSSYLCALMPARVKMGYSRHTDGSLHAIDGWSHYMQAVIQSDGVQNIHLTDLLTTQLLTALQMNVGEPVLDAGNEPVSEKRFFNTRVFQENAEAFSTAHRWVGIQLGAGRADKTWPAENWAWLVSRLFDEVPGVGVVLLGGVEDEDRARRFIASLPSSEQHLVEGRLLNRVGVTAGEFGFDAWVDCVSRCQWIMAGDTAVIHLASVLGVRVLNLSIGRVKWAETGPYGNGHMVVAPLAGEQEIDPDSVYEAWSSADAGLVAGLWPTEGKTTEVQVFRSRIRTAEDGGGVTYEPVQRDRFVARMSLSDWQSEIMGIIARAWYCGWVPEVGHGIARDRMTPELLKKLREVDESADVLLKISREAEAVANRLARCTQGLKSERVMTFQDRQEIHELGQKLEKIDELIVRTAQTQPILNPFSRLLKVLMHNIVSKDLNRIALESIENYRQIAQGAEIMRDWARATLKLGRPRVVELVRPAEDLQK